MNKVLQEKRSVLLVGTFLSDTRGVRSVCEDLALRLSQAGWRVVTTSGKPGRLSRLIDITSTTWLKRHEYEVAQVDLYSGQAFIWAEAACSILRLANKPYVLTLHGGDLPSFAGRWPRRVRALLRSAAAVTVPSRYLLERMIQYRDDLQLQPNPLSLADYEFGFRSNPSPNLIWLRAFHRIYNPSLAPRVLALLVEEFPDIGLTMIGPDKEDGSLEEMWSVASKLGVEKRIHATGKVAKKEIPSWLNRSDIFLNTTNVDNTPVSVLEAMACGLCVVSTNVGGIPYLLKHERDALLTPKDDAPAMARAVRRILKVTRLAEHLSQNGRAKAESFDWSQILPRWEKILTVASKGRDALGKDCIVEVKGSVGSSVN